jgi:cytosine/adenosine deaminase-related metal-dependent hydrolase
MHLSESPEEADLFARAAGPLQEYCRRIFPGAPEHRGTTPVRWLESRGLLPERALLVHGNHLDPVDLDLLARSAACVVHCPSSHAFFGHRPFPYPELRKHGIPVCLGTDSLASGDSLSMLDQIRLFRKNFPALPAEEALRMATLTAARALRMENEIGALLPGRKADFIAVRAPGNGNPREAVLRPEAEVALSVIGGLAAYRHSQLQF